MAKDPRASIEILNSQIAKYQRQMSLNGSGDIAVGVPSYQSQVRVAAISISSGEPTVHLKSLLCAVCGRRFGWRGNAHESYRIFFSGYLHRRTSQLLPDHD